MLHILDLLREKGIDAKKESASRWGSPCPNCGGRDRFRIWLDDRPGGSYWCQQCGLSGDNIEFCREFLGMDFKDACEHVGREVEKSPTTPRQVAAHRGSRTFEPARPGLPPALWQQRAAEFVDWAHKHLLANAAQLDYLAGRGIDMETIKRFRLGYNPGERGQDIYRPREVWGLPEDMKEDGKTPKRLWIPRGLVIPVFAPQAGTQNPVRIRIRRPKEHLRQGDSKYIVLPGSTAHTLVTDAEAKAFVVVEAELDALLISQAMDAALPGSAGAIALGSLAHKPDAATHELLAQSMCVLVALDFEPVDPDADPKKAANLRRIYSWWPQHYPRAERWPVPQGKDPGDAYTAGVDIASWVTAGLPPVLRLKHAGSVTDGPCASGWASGGRVILDVPLALRRPVAELARHMAARSITLRRETGTDALLLPQGGKESASSALEEMIFLIPDDLAAWLKGAGVDEVTAEMLGGGRG